MIPGVVEGANCRLGAPADWDNKAQGACASLCVRIEEKNGLPQTHSAWYPTVEELHAMVAGAPVHLTICLDGMPAVKLGVGQPADPVGRWPRVRQILRSLLGVRAVTITFDEVPTDAQLAMLREHLSCE